MFVNLDTPEIKAYNPNYMESRSIVDRLLKNMGNMHELGRQRAFELGNPFYAQFAEDGGYWRRKCQMAINTW